MLAAHPCWSDTTIQDDCRAKHSRLECGSRRMKPWKIREVRALNQVARTRRRTATLPNTIPTAGAGVIYQKILSTPGNDGGELSQSVQCREGVRGLRALKTCGLMLRLQLDGDSTGVVDPLQQDLGALLGKVLVDGASRALPVTIVVDDQDPTDRQSRK